MSRKVGFCGDFEAVMSLDQSQRATFSRVGLSGWAMLQRVKIPSDMVATVDVTMIEFIRDWSLR